MLGATACSFIIHLVAIAEHQFMTSESWDLLVTPMTALLNAEHLQRSMKRIATETNDRCPSAKITQFSYPEADFGL